MEFICTKENLLYGVQVVARAVSVKTTMPILTGIYLETKGNQLKLMATDMEIGIECVIPVQTLKEGSIVINARYLSEVVRRLPQVDLRVFLNEENHSLELHYGKSSFTLHTMNPEEFPILPPFDSIDELRISQETFKQLVRQVAFAASTDENRPLFNGVLLEINNLDLRMVATDTHRLALMEGKLLSNSSEEPKQINIYSRTLSEVSKLLMEDEEELKIRIAKSQVLFQTRDTRIVARLIEGQYPNYRQVIPSGFKSKLTVKTRDFQEAVERAALTSLGKEAGNIIKLQLAGNTLVIRSNSAEVGKVHEEIYCELEGEETQIAFNYRYLLEALKILDFEDIQLELTGSLSPGIIRPVEDDGYLYLILPVRTN